MLRASYAAGALWTDGTVDEEGLHTFHTARSGRAGDTVSRDPDPHPNDIMELVIRVTREHHATIDRGEVQDTADTIECGVFDMPDEGQVVGGKKGLSLAKFQDEFVDACARLTHRFNLAVPVIPPVELPAEIAEPIDG